MRARLSAAALTKPRHLIPARLLTDMALSKRYKRGDPEAIKEFKRRQAKRAMKKKVN